MTWIHQELLAIWEDHQTECHLRECLLQAIPWDQEVQAVQEALEVPQEECLQVECPQA